MNLLHKLDLPCIAEILKAECDDQMGDEVTTVETNPKNGDIIVTSTPGICAEEWLEIGQELCDLLRKHPNNIDGYTVEASTDLSVTLVFNKGVKPVYIHRTKTIVLQKAFFSVMVRQHIPESKGKFGQGDDDKWYSLDEEGKIEYRTYNEKILAKLNA